MSEMFKSNDEEFFKWSPEYSVNIKTIDNQHKELISILNRLFVAVCNREADSAITGILEALITYTKTHFALEERLMRAAKYKDIEAHIEEHRKLMEQVDQLCKKHVLKEQGVYFEMLRFLKKWLKDHIKGVDTKYSLAFEQAKFSVSEWELEATAEFAAMAASKKWWEIWKAA